MSKRMSLSSSAAFSISFTLDISRKALFCTNQGNIRSFMEKGHITFQLKFFLFRFWITRTFDFQSFILSFCLPITGKDIHPEFVFSSSVQRVQTFLPNYYLKLILSNYFYYGYSFICSFVRKKAIFFFFE